MLFRWFRTIRNAFRLAIPLLRDARVPLPLKATTVLAALFIVSPLNILGDIPILGFFDDAALLGFLLNAFIHFAPRSVVNEYRAS